MQKMTHAEWTALAKEARGFGPYGRMTLEDYIEHRIKIAVDSVMFALTCERIDRRFDRMIDHIDAATAAIGRPES